MRISRFSVVPADDGSGQEVSGEDCLPLGSRPQQTFRVEVEMRMTEAEKNRFLELVRREWGVGVHGGASATAPDEPSLGWRGRLLRSRLLGR